MKRKLTYNQTVERSIITTYRKPIWNEFVRACKDYKLINNGDKIAVCISGGKDSMLLAKCMQQLKRVSSTDFSLEFICMDPGYNKENRALIEQNCTKLEIPVKFFETDIFAAANSASQGGAACYLCARMRRGHLYSIAQNMGCNKIALGHHLSDVIETTLMGMLYGAQLQAMQPKLHSTNFAGMQLIRPLYCVKENAIINWKQLNNLEFIACACSFVQQYSNGGAGMSKRQEVKALIASLKHDNPNVEDNLFNSIHNVMLDTFPKYKSHSKWHTLLEAFDD
ncbi:MAG: tRNA 2-thiocytidine biosynthesis protein TtcA [Clostridiales bacterium]|nr:tRNA 2-thiocytidine biosynthesis protein TtcA [Clostridiales bacterium]